MKRIKFNEDIHPLSEFRANAAALIGQVRSTKRPMVITQHGKSAAVILDVQEYESLLEKIEILREVQIAESQLQQGQGIEHELAREQTISRLREKK